jgi:hypothetical protein
MDVGYFVWYCTFAKNEQGVLLARQFNPAMQIQNYYQ